MNKQIKFTKWNMYGSFYIKDVINSESYIIISPTSTNKWEVSFYGIDTLIYYNLYKNIYNNNFFDLNVNFLMDKVDKLINNFDKLKYLI